MVSYTRTLLIISSPSSSLVTFFSLLLDLLCCKLGGFFVTGMTLLGFHSVLVTLAIRSARRVTVQCDLPKLIRFAVVKFKT